MDLFTEHTTASFLPVTRIGSGAADNDLESVVNQCMHSLVMHGLSIHPIMAATIPLFLKSVGSSPSPISNGFRSEEIAKSTFTRKLVKVQGGVVTEFVLTGGELMNEISKVIGAISSAGGMLTANNAQLESTLYKKGCSIIERVIGEIPEVLYLALQGARIARSCSAYAYPSIPWLAKAAKLEDIFKWTQSGRLSAEEIKEARANGKMGEMVRAKALMNVRGNAADMESRIVNLANGIDSTGGLLGFIKGLYTIRAKGIHDILAYTAQMNEETSTITELLDDASAIFNDPKLRRAMIARLPNLHKVAGLSQESQDWLQTFDYTNQEGPEEKFALEITRILQSMKTSSGFVPEILRAINFDHVMAYILKMKTGALGICERPVLLTPAYFGGSVGARLAFTSNGIDDAHVCTAYCVYLLSASFPDIDTAKQFWTDMGRVSTNMPGCRPTRVTPSTGRDSTIGQDFFMRTGPITTLKTLDCREKFTIKCLMTEETEKISKNMHKYANIDGKKVEVSFHLNMEKEVGDDGQWCNESLAAQARVFLENTPSGTFKTEIGAVLLEPSGGIVSADPQTGEISYNGTILLKVAETGVSIINSVHWIKNNTGF